ncbi:hypothetical protein [Yersinia intermedia]|uniref:hypothetical protein n=1 Tax=Yersinia intermedia TaxID=631 RepID=UPI0021BDC2DD|nr:hypothetical protein [Yersinia intermedia]
MRLMFWTPRPTAETSSFPSLRLPGAAGRWLGCLDESIREDWLAADTCGISEAAAIPAPATNSLRRSGIVRSFWLFIDRSVSQKIEHESHLSETILRRDCQHKADGYLTALSETLSHLSPFPDKNVISRSRC